jgi:hypothetical protein
MPRCTAVGNRQIANNGEVRCSGDRTIPFACRPSFGNGLIYPGLRSDIVTNSLLSALIGPEPSRPPVTMCQPYLFILPASQGVPGRQAQRKAAPCQRHDFLVFASKLGIG